MVNPAVTTDIKAPKGTVFIVALVFAFVYVSLEVTCRVQEDRDFNYHQTLCRKAEELTWNPHPNFQAAEKLWRDELAARWFNSSRNIMYAKAATKLADLLYTISANSETTPSSEAERLYKESIKIYENLYGTADSSEAVEGLGNLYDSQGRVSDAELQYKKCLNALKYQRPLRYGRIRDTAISLVRLEMKQKRYREAEAVLQDVILVGEKTDLFLNGKDGTILGELGNVYSWHGRYEEAVSAYKSAMNSGVTDLNYTRSMLAYPLHKLGRDAEAEKLYKQNLEQRRRIKVIAVDPNLKHIFDPQRSNNLRDLGELYIDQKRFSEAEPLLTEAIAINKQCLTVNDSHSFRKIYLDDTKGIYQKLAKIYRLQGRKKEATAAFKSINELALIK